MMLSFKKNWHIGEMTPLHYTNKSAHTPSINKLTPYINLNTSTTSGTQLNNDPHTTCIAHDNLQPKIKSSILMPSDVKSTDRYH